MAKSLKNICPACFVYDPSWFVHYEGCPFYKATRVYARVALVLFYYRKHGVVFWRRSGRMEG